MKVALIVPVRNGGAAWARCAAGIAAQSRQPDRVLVIDSESTDGSDQVALDHGFGLQRIQARDFDHGGTRQLAAEQCTDCDILVYLTQDAELADPDALRRLLEVFDDAQVAVAYGRQLPRLGAGPIEAHARLFNYPAQCQLRTSKDVQTLGLKAAFTSNSFCAYRRSDLLRIGGFPPRVIVSEDMVTAARALQAGRAVAYVADACVLHSHGYTLAQELGRYFDIGVLHNAEHWLLEDFGKADGEGLRFVVSQVAYLLRVAPWRLPEAAVRTVFKYLGYKAGLHCQRLPPRWRAALSRQPGYWGARDMRDLRRAEP